MSLWTTWWRHNLLKLNYFCFRQIMWKWLRLQDPTYENLASVLQKIFLNMKSVWCYEQKPIVVTEHFHVAFIFLWDCAMEGNCNISVCSRHISLSQPEHKATIPSPALSWSLTMTSLVFGMAMLASHQAEIGSVNIWCKTGTFSPSGIKEWDTSLFLCSHRRVAKFISPTNVPMN